MIKILFIFTVILGIALNASEIDDLEKECESGNMKQCGILGFMYIKGDKIKVDAAKAGKYMTKACNGGEMGSCYNMASLMKSFYEATCQGVQNKQCQQMADKEIELFTKACDGGLTDACRELGLIYFKGKMVKQDISKTTNYLLKACDSGNAASCYFLAEVTKDTLVKAQKYTDTCQGEGQKQCQQLADSVILFYTKEPLANSNKKLII